VAAGLEDRKVNSLSPGRGNLANKRAKLQIAKLIETFYQDPALINIWVYRVICNK